MEAMKGAQSARIEIDADFDAITCVGCRVCVGRGRVCPCPLRTQGPCAENETRKRLVEGEQ
jgi:hypothetical protein